MIPYELLPHEYSYALFLSYEYDLWPSHPMILNMVSERYPRDEDEASDCDADSDSNSEIDEDFSDDVPQWLFLEPQEEDDLLFQQNSSQNGDGEIVFGCFGQDSDLAAILADPLIIEPEFDGFTIKIGEIACYLVPANRSGNLISRTFKPSNNGGSFINEQRLFPEVEDERTIDLQFDAAGLPVSVVNEELRFVTKENQTEHHQDPPSTVILQFAVIPDLERSLHREIVRSVFGRHLADFNTSSFAKICARSEIKILALDLSCSSDCFEIVSKIVVPSPTKTVESDDSISATPSQDFVFLFDPGGFSTYTAFVVVSTVSAEHRSDFVFDPGGTLTDTAVASNIQFFDHPSVWIAVFEPGRKHRRSPLIFVVLILLFAVHSLLGRFQKVLCCLRLGTRCTLCFAFLAYVTIGPSYFGPTGLHRPCSLGYWTTLLLHPLISFSHLQRYFT